MMPFGHLGIGTTLVRPFTAKRPLRAVLLGTLLPDLIDKPLYVALKIATGRCGDEIGLVSGTRTFAHTGLFCIILWGVALKRKSAALVALAWGVVSHLFLDQVVDWFGWYGHVPEGPSALTWPFLSRHFYAANCSGDGSIWDRYLLPGVWSTEVIGLAIVVYWIQASRREPFNP